MKAQDLKNSILQLAIQGKLVEQSSNDEPASVLLEKIKKEKSELIKQGKIKKDKQESFIFKGDDNKYYEKIGSETKDITDEIPFEIPSSWEWVRFHNLVVYHMGKTPQRKEEIYWKQPKYNWVSIADLKSNEFIYSTKEKVNEYAFDKIFKNRISKAGTLLMSFKLTIGKVSILGIDAFHNEAIISIYPILDKECTVRNFLFKILPRISLLGKSKSAIKGDTLNSDSIDNLLIPFPPLAEQERIVAKIEELEPLVQDYDATETELTNLNSDFPNQLKKSILQYAVQGKLVKHDPNDEPASELLKKIQAEKLELIKQGKIKKDKQESYIYKGDDNHYYEKIGSNISNIDKEIPFEIPSSWEWCRLGNISFVTKLAGFEYTKYIAGSLVKQGIPLFKGKNVKDGKIIYNFESFIPEEISDFLVRSQVNKKCILTPYVGTIGNIAIHKKNGRFHLGSNVGKIELYNNNSEHVLEEYVVFYVKSSYGYKELTKNKKATAQESISIEAIREILIPLPPLSEQKRIVNKIEEIFAQIEKL